jgi:hypothetical protein
MKLYTLPRLFVSDGSIESMKWLALLLMTGDHINKYLFNETLPYLFEIGRVAMPLFVFVLAYNLARPGVYESGAYIRTMTRLTIFGLLATPAFLALGGLLGGWWPLNIMFALLAITVTLFLIENRTVGGYVAAAMVFLIGGAFVEFWWPAITFGLAVWWYYKKPGLIPFALALASILALWVVNRNSWALAAVPIILMFSRIDVRTPRLRWAFYGYYPIHLVALLLIRIPMSNVEYLFF